MSDHLTSKKDTHWRETVRYEYENDENEEELPISIVVGLFAIIPPKNFSHRRFRFRFLKIGNLSGLRYPGKVVSREKMGQFLNEFHCFWLKNVF